MVAIACLGKWQRRFLQRKPLAIYAVDEPFEGSAVQESSARFVFK